MERSNGAVKTAFDLQVDGKRGPGRPKLTRKQLTERDCREWKLSAIDPHDGHYWRSGVRSAMLQQASYMYLDGGPLMWMMPLYLHVKGVVGWCKGAVYLSSPGRPTDIGLQLGKTCYPCSG